MVPVLCDNFNRQYRLFYFGSIILFLEEKAKRLESQIRDVARRARQEWRKSVTGEDNDLARVAMALLSKHKAVAQATIAEEPHK